ncbi:MAG: hypothetical protein HY078_09790 [Elusimicrobia bacterium]|nr:hypothetical protein [Elusimicrobiota bacterium]
MPFGSAFQWRRGAALTACAAVLAASVRPDYGRAPADGFEPAGFGGGKALEMALIGDSLSTNFHLAGTWSMIQMCRRAHRSGGNWFMDPQPATSGIVSLAALLGRLTRVRAVNRSTVGSYVDGAFPDARHPVVMWVMRSLTFRQQVTRLIEKRDFPDVVLVWVGHPNLDWVRGFQKYGRGDIPGYLGSIADRMARTYDAQLRRLVRRADEKRTPTLILVYGLVDMRSGARSRQTMMGLKTADPGRYPRLYDASDIFLGLRPENSAGTSELRDLVNERMKRVVESLAASGKVLVEYSDALARVDISDPLLANRHDAWHASAAGHSRWAEAAFADLEPRLRRHRLLSGNPSAPRP